MAIASSKISISSKLCAFEGVRFIISVFVLIVDGILRLYEIIVRPANSSTHGPLLLAQYENILIASVISFCLVSDFVLIGFDDSSPVFTARCTMHSAKRGLAIACRLSVRLSVCDVGDL